MKRYLSLPAILMLLLFSCKNTDKDTQLFERYLQEHLNRSIEKNDQIYILLSNSACSGCAKYIFEKAKTPDKKFIFILPMPDNGFNYQFDNVLIDSSNAIGRLKFHMGNVCTIKTEDGAIEEVKVYEPFEVENIFK